MRGRKPEPVKLKSKDAIELRRLLRNGHTPQREAQRARILLACAQAERVQQVATQAEQHRTTIWRVRERYRQAGLSAALYDAPRSGRPRVFFQTATKTD
ncbi:MAG: helix-turn-helix domain-containing protein [Terriglobales bacterium]